MTFPIAHKTVIVLNHGPYFGESCQQNIEFDIFTKSRQPGFIPLAPITKSLWTCNVEAAVEYIRVVYDLFPKGRLLRLIVSDTKAYCLNTWSQDEQSLHHLMTALAQVGPADITQDPDDCNIFHGLNLAVEILCECSEIQHEVRTSLTENASRIVNKGRIICFTDIKNDSHSRLLEKCVQDSLFQHNKLAASSDNLMCITHCDLVLIHTVPVNEEPVLMERIKKEISSILSSEVVASKSGRHIATRLVQLVQKHYDLTSTTVTGIPMKEEQNANSSANYDVELLHSLEAHSELIKTGFANVECVKSNKEGTSYETVTLKWCTPRSSGVGMELLSTKLQFCTGAYRVTPMDVNSRPSSCLTNFLLNGRAVMLEQPRKSGTKVISHMLTSHGGEIFIHCLPTTRSALEDPPSISEGCGGRVTDYRIQDFGEFMKENRLAPLINFEGCEMPLKKAKKQLERMTRHWPLVIGETILYNMLSHLDPLPSLIVKEQLDDYEIVECKKVIYHVVDLETKNEHLSVPSSGSRGKGPKREEQYRQLWSELELLIRAHSDTSSAHEKILECLLECKKPVEESTKGNSSPKKPEKIFIREEKLDSEVEQAWKDFDKYSKMTEREKQDYNKGDAEFFKYRSTDSPPIKKMKTSFDEVRGKTTGPQTLMQIWANRINMEHSKHHEEFAGRVASVNNVAQLYTNLNNETEGET